VREWSQVVARRRWLVLAALITAPLLALIVSHGQQRLYQASAEVLVSEKNPTASALNVTSGTPSPPDRYAATQAGLARVATVLQMTATAAKLPGRTAAELYARSTVTADANADLLTFSVSDPDPAYARRLADIYATEFTVYRRRLDSAAVAQAIGDAQRKLSAMVAAGRRHTALYASLQATTRELEELQTVQATTSSATVVNPAGNASQVQPKTKRNVALGLLVGLALGLCAAFLRDSLDTRVRSVEELRDALGLTLIGTVPRFDRETTSGRRLPTLVDQEDAAAQAFAAAATGFEAARERQGARSVAVTSVREDAGKSTTAANLAVTLASCGRRVILLDLDPGRTTLHHLFGLDEAAATTSAFAAEYASHMVDLPNVDGSSERARLEVCAAGGPSDVARLLLSRGLPQTIAQLRKRCDLLLVNAPPITSGSRALPVAAGVDALIVVGAVNETRRAAIAEARRVLASCSTPPLGLVATYETGDSMRSLAAAAWAVASRVAASAASPHRTETGRRRATAVLRALGRRA